MFMGETREKEACKASGATGKVCLMGRSGCAYSNLPKFPTYNRRMTNLAIELTWRRDIIMFMVSCHCYPPSNHMHSYHDYER